MDRLPSQIFLAGLNRIIAAAKILYLRQVSDSEWQYLWQKMSWILTIFGHKKYWAMVLAVTM